MRKEYLILVITFLILNVFVGGCIKFTSEDIEGKIIFRKLDSNNQSNVWEIDIKGKNQKLIPKFPLVGRNNISRDGKKIIYTITNPKIQDLFDVFKLEESKIILKDLETEKEIILTKGYVDTSPSFSPDSKKIAFSSKRDGEDYEIYIMDVDGTNVLKLTDNSLDDYGPEWSPDGKKIIFTSEIPFIYKGGSLKVGDPEYEKSFNSAEIYMIDINSKGVHRLTNNSVNDRFPIWSPDGKKIAFISESELCIKDLERKTLTQLTKKDKDYLVVEPCWSPDSKKISFLAVQQGATDIYVIDIKWKNLRNITNSPHIYKANLAWLPVSPLDK